MKAKIKPYYDTKRRKLSDIIPLESPFTVYVEATRYCNIKCFYCIQSTRDDVDGEMRKLELKVKHMDQAKYETLLDQLSKFPSGGIKRIVFSGLGEPLMNPNLPTMLKKAVDAKICDRVEIITNGLLLTPEISSQIIDSGITNINISIQGVSEAQYEKTCGKKISFSRFISNLEYLFKIKRDTTIYIKAIDATLDGKDNEDEFYSIFGNLADKIYVEHLVVMQQQMDSLKKIVDNSRNFYNEEITSERDVCAQAFYFLQIGCDFDTFPCPVPGLPKTMSMGNMNEESLLEIWNGGKRRKLLKMMLAFEREKLPECKDCTSFKCINDPLENLDIDAHKLVGLFED